MNIKTITTIFEENSTIKSKLHFDRYIRFVDSYIKKDLVKPVPNRGEFELHHILPKNMFPEYEHETWNHTIMPLKAHYLAHYLLFKAIDHKSLVYAFNQMKRVCLRLGNPNCRLYESVRLEFAVLIGKNNTGLIRSDEFCKDVSERFRGKNNYRNENTGEIKSFVVGQQPEGWITFQTGRVRTSESKENMASIMSGRIWQYNEETKEIKFEKTLLDGFKPGYAPWTDVSCDILKTYSWIHNTETQENIRIDISNGIPEGFVLGRGKYNNAGFDLINNKDFVRVVDLVEKKFCLIPVDSFPNTRYIKHGSSIDGVFLFKYNNIVYTSFKDFVDMHPELPLFKKRNPSIMSMKVPRVRSDMPVERQEFCKNNAGKTMSYFGLLVMPLQDYIYKESEIYVRR